MTAPLTLLQVHAHPDDESSKGAATVAKYRAEGIRSALVCCTGGEEGDILNPDVDHPDVRADLHTVRMGELKNAIDIIGYDSYHLLGYRDSGMPETEANARPDNFANAPLDEAVGRLVAAIRVERPSVVVTYGPEQSRYPHPDHLRVHEITGPACERAADPRWYPEAGEPWKVTKLYYTRGFTRARMLKMHDWIVGQGEKSPFEDWIGKIPDDADHGITTQVHVADHLHTAREALLAHRTQVSPNTGFMRVSVEVMRELHPWEEYELAHSHVEVEIPESCLFTGLR